MLENTQQYPRTGTDLQSLPAAGDDDPLAQVDTLKIVACPVCRAIYVPSGEQRAPDLLETAFLAVCHFCFRCQRPACPQCWNPIHHVCASCSEEARLPFRGPVPSLEGLVFTSARSARANKVSFLCQRNGRFYTPEPAQPHLESRQAPASVSAANPQGSPGALPVLPPDYALPAQVRTDTYPTWLQEVFGQKVEDSAAPAVEIQPLEYPVQMYAQAEPTFWSPAQQPDWPTLVPIAPQQAAPVEALALSAPAGQPLSLAPPATVTDDQGEHDAEDEEISLLERIENALIVITSVLLLSVILMIVLSISSAQVNAFILSILHIDIRTEIAYLLQLR